MRAKLFLGSLGALTLWCWWLLSASADPRPTHPRPTQIASGSPKPDRDQARAQERERREDGQTRTAVEPDTGLRLVVTDGRSPAAGITITAWSQHARKPWQAMATGTTDTDGQLSLALPPGCYALWVSGPGRPLDAVLQERRVRTGELLDVAVALPAPASVRGKVLDALGRPLAGVSVASHYGQWLLQGQVFANRVAAPQPTVTDAAGQFELTNLAPGAKTLMFRHPHHAPKSQGGTLEPGLMLDMGEIRLSLGFDLSGRVVSLAGVPLAGATVEVSDNPQRTTTDERGRFWLQHVAADATLHFAADGHIGRRVLLGQSGSRWHLSEFFWRRPNEPIDVPLHDSLSILGTVTGFEGHATVRTHNYATNTRLAESPVPVTCWSSDGEIGADGSFAIDKIHAGKVEIQAWAPGHGYSRVITLTAEEPVHRVALTIEKTRSLRVRVTDDADTALGGVEIGLKGHNKDDNFRCLFSSNDPQPVRTTDDQGVAIFGGMLSGEYEIAVEALGHLPAQEKFELVDGLEEKHIRMTRAARLLVEADGVPADLRHQLQVQLVPHAASPASDSSGITLKLADAARGAWIRPGRYAIGWKMPKYGDGFLESGRAAEALTQVDLLPTETTRCRLPYRGVKTIRGRVFEAGRSRANLTVHGLRPESWREREKNAYFLNYNLGLYGAKAISNGDGIFTFHVTEPGPWCFVASPAGASIPLPLGEIVIRDEVEDYEPVFQLDATYVRGSLSQDFYRDGCWLPVLLVPASLAKHDPLSRIQGIDDPGDSPLEMFGRHPARDGSFEIGPLAPGSWTLSIRDGQQLLLTIALSIDKNNLDLGPLSAPAAGPLVVLVEPAPQGRTCAVLRPADGNGGNAPFLASAVSDGGEFRFGLVPFGQYRVELGDEPIFGLWLGVNSEASCAVIEHRGSAPARIVLQKR